MEMAKLIEEERMKVVKHDANHIFLGGVGQGCGIAISTYFVWEGPQPLGGVACLGGIEPLDLYKLKITEN